MTLFLFALLIVGAALAFIYFDSHRSAAAKLQEPDPVDDLILDLETETRRIQACIQAGIVGDKYVSGAIESGSYTGPLPERRADGGWLSIYDNLRILKIAGINHRQGISRYVGRVECALVPEPDNEYDPDAIKIVAEDRHHLGYIPSGQTDLVCSLTANEFPYRCTAFIEECEDEGDGHKFFTGFVYIRRLD
jgi:hypothetical protein